MRLRRPTGTNEAGNLRKKYLPVAQGTSNGRRGSSQVLSATLLPKSYM